MKTWVLMFGLVLCLSTLSFSADEPILFGKTKALVDRVDPRGGVFFNRKNHTIQAITSARVVTADVKGFKVDGTLSYAVDKTVLAGAETDLLEALSKIPGVEIKIPWLRIHTGMDVGWSIEDGQIAYGPVVDGSVKF